jgi:hypothetical protein
MDFQLYLAISGEGFAARCVVSFRCRDSLHSSGTTPAINLQAIDLKHPSLVGIVLASSIEKAVLDRLNGEPLGGASGSVVPGMAEGLRRRATSLGIGHGNQVCNKTRQATQ